MEQEKLFFEDLREAIRDTIRALGGPKAVGHQMKPHLDAEAAGRWVNDALNDARSEVMSYEQLRLLMQMGRHAGVHNIAVQLMRECGYQDPRPVEPADEAAQLQKEFLAGVRKLEQLAKQLGGTTVAAVWGASATKGPNSGQSTVRVNEK